MNNEINNEQNIQSQQFVSEYNVQSQGQFTQTLKSPKNNKTKLGLIIGIIVAVLTVAGLISFFLISMNSPKNVYKKLLKNGINETFDIIYNNRENAEKVNTTVNLDLELDLTEGLLDEFFVDLINKTTIGLNYQIDTNNKQLVVKVDSDYDKESLIDLQLFVDSKNEKTYLYAKDYLDKYIEVPVEDYSSISELFETNNLTSGQMVNAKKAQKIITDELTSIIKSEDCSKEDGAYVFEITGKELVNRIKTALTNLKNNEKFLECYKDSNITKEGIDSIIESLDEESLTMETIKFSVNKKMFSKNIEKLKISDSESEFVFEIKEDKTEYSVFENNEKIANGYIKITEEKDIDKFEFSVNIPSLGEIAIKLDTITIVGKDVEKIDTSKVTTIDQLTETEQMEIMNKLQESKLYELLELVMGSFGTDDDYIGDDYFDDGYMDDEYFDDDYIDDDFTTGTSVQLETNDGQTVNLNIPSGFTNTYDADDYKVFKKDGIAITFTSSSYDDADDYLDIVDSYKEAAVKDEKYKNIISTSKISYVVGGRTYYYRDYSYLYSFITDTQYYEKYICTHLGNNSYLVIEIESKNQEIPFDLLNQILSIN